MFYQWMLYLSHWSQQIWAIMATISPLMIFYYIEAQYCGALSIFYRESAAEKDPRKITCESRIRTHDSRSHEPSSKDSNAGKCLFQVLWPPRRPSRVRDHDRLHDRQVPDEGGEDRHEPGPLRTWKAQVRDGQAGWNQPGMITYRFFAALLWWVQMSLSLN